VSRGAGELRARGDLRPAGLGLSDPLAGPITLEDQVEDLDAVIAAAGFDQPALLGLSDQGRTCVLFAAPTRAASVRS
jgi:pimeloyl-ACP methyl ester carboxylesterase